MICARRKPIVWVTGPDRGGEAAWWFTRFAVLLAGGRAKRLTPEREKPKALPDALILGGGADVGDEDPADQTKEDNAASNKAMPRSLKVLSNLLWAPVVFIFRFALSRKDIASTDPARDYMERRLLGDALKRGIPVLGICRGMQLINLELGGTLHAEVGGFYKETPHLRTVRPLKPIIITKGSRIFSILGQTNLYVNALHHQAVNELGKGLVITAMDEVGVVQGIEHPGELFMVGIQWHPEYLPAQKEQRAIFKALVVEAKMVHQILVEP